LLEMGGRIIRSLGNCTPTIFNEGNCIVFALVSIPDIITHTLFHLSTHTTPAIKPSPD
jgi:hypothetical protein